MSKRILYNTHKCKNISNICFTHQKNVHMIYIHLLVVKYLEIYIFQMYNYISF